MAQSLFRTGLVALGTLICTGLVLWLITGQILQFVALAVIILAAQALIYARQQAVPETEQAQSAQSKSDQTLHQLARNSGANAISTAELSFAITNLHQVLASTVERLQQVAKSSDVINRRAQDIHHITGEVAEAGEQTRLISIQGQQQVESLSRDITEIVSASRQAEQTIAGLRDKAEKIRSVTNVIQSIADQTNLLALNAAIESARAGEHGRGFAVVADEVRTLALRTSKATVEVGELVEGIHHETQQAADIINRLAEQVDRQSATTHQVADQLGQIARHAEEVDQQLKSIAGSLGENQQDLSENTLLLDSLTGDLSSQQQQMKQLTEQAERLESQAEQLLALLVTSDDSSAHRRIFSIAEQTARRIGQRLEQALAKGELSEAQLFSRDYTQVKGIALTKFDTPYSAFFDRILPEYQEQALNSEDHIVYAIVTDPNGYVARHNNGFNQPLTGDSKKDLLGNRSRRMFDDKTGSRCGAHTQQLLLQTYKRDTGEVMHDLSVPLYVNNKHWGGFRIGYRPLE
ncbi:methyl-accepting chemotaxis protein [Lacimicrobium alkaliphilum]|uniref:Chemotaxis protein n=1 Tax=Lacimicrobium alkaliphilum TaxID=1526571 RepID=A0A0U2PDL2_9ALTE|nr:methyl-accepting chemotaxis protein [Lacimicrobium alkaliphilum]ALS97149.1 chemotaxis protein [Lacimicrobium alkaliphilum]